MRPATSLAERLLGSAVASIEAVDGGRNGRVYRVTSGGGETYALKTYFRHASDSRPRLRTEFDALTFLWAHGERRIPRPIAAAEDDDVAVYQWIEGEKIGIATAEAVHSAADFLVSLARLRHRPEAALLPPASEACFSGRVLAANIRGRLQPLLDVPELSSFLQDELLPVFEQLKFRGGEFPVAARTLSPSDFGFHNALRTAEGMVFLDFEYFGWDDPAKMICDFLLHPGFVVPATLKRAFKAAILREFPDARDRVEAYYPLFGLKWCTILLNEFLPAALERRRFAGLSEEDRAMRQTEQLDKARVMLQAIRDGD